MKFDKKNPVHWLHLVIFTANTLLVLLVRRVRKKRLDTVILYGHKLNGNLKAIQQHALKTPGGPQFFFLTMDLKYYNSLKEKNKNTLLGLNPLHMLKLISAQALISDHGLHCLVLLLQFSDLKFIDVWHGIPFKGFDYIDFRVQHKYDEVWVPSRRLKTMYSERYGFHDEKLKVTGYARTDLLVNANIDCNEIKNQLGICDLGKKIILFAPTWQQDHKSRNIFPFELNENDFLFRINEFCLTHDVVCILRKHLNTKTESSITLERIFNMPYEEYPDVEEILLISDVLICDWSSIAFDYLILDRPTLFLDVPPPFSKGFSLDATYRFGRIVHDIEELFLALETYLDTPEKYHVDFAHSHRTVYCELYENMADGHASERCYRRLCNLL